MSGVWMRSLTLRALAAASLPLLLVTLAAACGLDDSGEVTSDTDRIDTAADGDTFACHYRTLCNQFTGLNVESRDQGFGVCPGGTKLPQCPAGAISDCAGSTKWDDDAFSFHFYAYEESLEESVANQCEAYGKSTSLDDLLGRDSESP